MKTDFEARPVYLNRQDRIMAHFITCFIALERKLDNKYTIDQILPTITVSPFYPFKAEPRDLWSLGRFAP